MIDLACSLGIAVLSGCVVLGLVRLARGPTVLDRLLALDAVLFFGVGILGAFSILGRTAVYLELILVVALLGFFTMVAFFYYLHRLPRAAPEFGADGDAGEGGNP
jgi:multisubunit Na+/H+ antiporter MnhF subunit